MTGAVGVVGGMGPQATWRFFGQLIEATPAKRDQDHLRVIIDSDPTIPDRTAFLLGQGPDPRPKMIDSARRVELAGASLVVMPCNTASVFREDVAREVTIPVFDWIGRAVVTALDFSTGRVGLMATDGTIRSMAYQSVLERRRIDVVIPDAAQQREIMRVIYEGVKGGDVTGEMANRLTEAAEQLRSRGAETIVLGCTELPLVLPSQSPRWPVPTIDPSLVAAREIAERFVNDRLAASGK